MAYDALVNIGFEVKYHMSRLHVEPYASQSKRLPPQAADVQRLMADFVVWIAAAQREALPAPVIAGLAHYQFVTIHPFFDGNGRTARTLATWILYRHGYDLGRFYSLEEAYATDLTAYYAALQTHPHHNYYEGRADADLTGWLAYFLDAMATTFRRVAQEVRERAGQVAAPGYHLSAE